MLGIRVKPYVGLFLFFVSTSVEEQVLGNFEVESGLGDRFRLVLWIVASVAAAVASKTGGGPGLESGCEGVVEPWSLPRLDFFMTPELDSEFD